jgi:hypothetical protein
MPVYSGKYGNVHYDIGAGLSSVKAIRNWVINEKSTPFEYAHSKSSAGRGRSPGIYDFSGSFQAFGTVPVVMPGDFFNFEGFTAAIGAGIVIKTQTNTTVGHPLENRRGAIVDSVEINWDYQTGGLIGYTVNFSQANAFALTKATEVQVDSGTYTPQSVCPTNVAYTSSSTILPNVSTSTLMLNSNNISYVNSSTNCRTAREKGILDATIAISEQNNNPVFVVGTRYQLFLFIDALTYWDLKGVLAIEYTDFRVNVETGEIIQFTDNFALQAVNEANGVVDGYIARPGETSVNAWWPVVYNT